jgi:hypothetical protein
VVLRRQGPGPSESTRFRATASGLPCSPGYSLQWFSVQWPRRPAAPDLLDSIFHGDCVSAPNSRRPTQPRLSREHASPATALVLPAGPHRVNPHQAVANIALFVTSSPCNGLAAGSFDVLSRQAALVDLPPRSRSVLTS